MVLLQQCMCVCVAYAKGRGDAYTWIVVLEQNVGYGTRSMTCRQVTHQIHHGI